jgi:hypothetical protein
MRGILLSIFLYCVDGAKGFRESLPGDTTTELYVWSIGTYFKVVCAFFIFATLVAWRNRIKFSQESVLLKENGLAFRPKDLNVGMFSFQTVQEAFIPCVSSVIRGLNAYTTEFPDATATYVIVGSTFGTPLGNRDEMLIKQIMASIPTNDRVEVIFLHQNVAKAGVIGAKRGGYMQIKDVILGNDGRKRLGRDCSPDESVIVFLDGDSQLAQKKDPKDPTEANPEDTFFRDAVGPLSVEKNIMALTINNRPRVDTESTWVVAMFWLRFIRRHFALLFATNVLTGRCAIFHGRVAADSKFWDGIGLALIDHKTHKKRQAILKGKLFAILPNMLHWLVDWAFNINNRIFYSSTGDDKSTVWYISRKGYKMLYNHLVYITCWEDLPRTWKDHPDVWWIQLIPFARRYTRNTQNYDSLFLSLGREKLGTLRYLMILKNRYFFWTPLMGFYAVPFLVFSLGTGYLYVYISWAILWTSVMTYVDCKLAKEPWSAYYPVILYHEHTVIVIVKIWALTSPKGGWTRQESTQQALNPRELVSFVIINLVILGCIGLFTGTLVMPGLDSIQLASHFLRN